MGDEEEALTPPIHRTCTQPSPQILINNPTLHYAIPKDGVLPGGRLTHFYKYWTQTTSHPFPLSVIKEGYKIQFATRPIPWKINPLNLDPTEQQAANEAVQKFLAAGIIEIMPNQSNDFLSKFFTIQEKTKRRPILNCQRLNQNVQCEHFKMEGVPALRELIEQGDFMCKIDLKDAYTVVPIHPESRKYLTFKNEGVVYQYRSLAFGLNVAPRLFSKLMRYAVEPLRQEGIRLVYYLDDICLLSKTKEDLHITVKKSIHTIPDTGILGVPIQYQKNENHSSITKNKQAITENSSSLTTNPTFLPLDSGSAGQDYLNDTGNRGSTSSHSSSSKGSSKESLLEQPKLGKTVSYILPESTGISMVEGVRFIQERPTYSSENSSITSDNDLHRQLRHGVGSELTNDGNIRVLEQSRQINVNKRPRTEGSLFCFENACSKIRKLHDKGFHRQHNSSQIHNEIWRYGITPITGISSSDSRSLQSIQPNSDLPTYCGDKEHISGSTITKASSTLRTDHSEKIIPSNYTSVGAVGSGRICSLTQSPTEEILEPSSRSISRSTGRVPTEMAQERDVSKSSLETNPQGDTTIEETEDTSSRFNYPSVAQPILVSNGPTDETLGQSNSYENQQEVLSDRMAIISDARRKFGLTDAASIEYLENSTRSSTKKIYDNGWRQWHRWCLQKTPVVNPIKYNCANVLAFLVANQHYSSKHLNTLRSSLASVFRELYPDEMPLALQPTIQAFFAAKRRSEVRIPTIQQLETWDTNRMTAFILSSWADSNTLTLTDLQLKTIALLCLATMARPRSDIGRLQFRDTIFKYQDSSNMTVSGLTLHFRVPKEAQVKTTQIGVLQDSRLCPVTTLHIFIQKTATLRTNLPVDHTLFLAYIEKPNLVSSIRPSTLSNWVKLLMERSGVDTNHFKAHSIRAASSTKAVSKGHSIEAVKDHAGWSQDSRTFETFYHKPPNQESSSTAIIHSIFSEAENTITLGDGVEPTEIDLGTTNNLNVGETKSKNVIDTHPWYRRFLGI
ncbi:hypothetical protein G6F38_011359 [Rhizopus arrhizus]|nr:hypothetical protein G6F38_011359 [Rhizopus arrhizus]